MEIEIRRNRDISFNVTCENPETLKELFQMTEDPKRLRKQMKILLLNAPSANRKRPKGRKAPQLAA